MSLFSGDGSEAGDDEKLDFLSLEAEEDSGTDDDGDGDGGDDDDYLLGGGADDAARGDRHVKSSSVFDNKHNNKTHCNIFGSGSEVNEYNMEDDGELSCDALNKVTLLLSGSMDPDVLDKELINAKRLNVHPNDAGGDKWSEEEYESDFVDDEDEEAKIDSNRHSNCSSGDEGYKNDILCDDIDQHTVGTHAPDGLFDSGDSPSSASSSCKEMEGTSMEMKSKDSSLLLKSNVVLLNGLSPPPSAQRSCTAATLAVSCSGLSLAKPRLDLSAVVRDQINNDVGSAADGDDDDDEIYLQQLAKRGSKRSKRVLLAVAAADSGDDGDVEEVGRDDDSVHSGGYVPHVVDDTHPQDSSGHKSTAVLYTNSSDDDDDDDDDDDVSTQISLTLDRYSSDGDFYTGDDYHSPHSDFTPNSNNWPSTASTPNASRYASASSSILSPVNSSGSVNTTPSTASTGSVTPPPRHRRGRRSLENCAFPLRYSSTTMDTSSSKAVSKGRASNASAWATVPHPQQPRVRGDERKEGGVHGRQHRKFPVSMVVDDGFGNEVEVDWQTYRDSDDFDYEDEYMLRGNIKLKRRCMLQRSAKGEIVHVVTTKLGRVCCEEESATSGNTAAAADAASQTSKMRKRKMLIRRMRHYYTRQKLGYLAKAKCRRPLRRFRVVNERFQNLFLRLARNAGSTYVVGGGRRLVISNVVKELNDV